jgi:hypothetical protein
MTTSENSSANSILFRFLETIAGLSTLYLKLVMSKDCKLENRLIYHLHPLTLLALHLLSPAWVTMLEVADKPQSVRTLHLRLKLEAQSPVKANSYRHIM